MIYRPLFVEVEIPRKCITKECRRTPVDGEVVCNVCHVLNFIAEYPGSNRGMSWAQLNQILMRAPYPSRTSG